MDVRSAKITREDIEDERRMDDLTAELIKGDTDRTWSIGVQHLGGDSFLLTVVDVGEHAMGEAP